MITYNLKINYQDPRILSSDMEFVSGDVGAYRLVFSFYDNGQRVDLTDCMLSVKAKRADGMVLSDAGTIQDNTGIFVPKTDFFSVPGEVLLEIALTDSAQNYITTKIITASVIQGLGTPDDVAENAVSIYVTLLNQVVAAKNSASAYAAQAAESAIQAAESAIQAAENGVDLTSDQKIGGEKTFTGTTSTMDLHVYDRLRVCHGEENENMTSMHITDDGDLALENSENGKMTFNGKEVILEDDSRLSSVVEVPKLPNVEDADTNKLYVINDINSTKNGMVYKLHEDGRDYRFYPVTTSVMAHTGVNYIEGEGHDVFLSVNTSHIEGGNHQVEKSFVHVEGEGNIANRDYQHIQGKYNQPAEGCVHIVGWGTDDDHRKNIHTIDTNGNGWFMGDVDVEGNVGARDFIKNGFPVATENYVDTAIQTAITATLSTEV